MCFTTSDSAFQSGKHFCCSRLLLLLLSHRLGQNQQVPFASLLASQLFSLDSPRSHSCFTFPSIFFLFTVVALQTAGVAARLQGPVHYLHHWRVCVRVHSLLVSYRRQAKNDKIEAASLLPRVFSIIFLIFLILSLTGKHFLTVT